MGFLLFSDERYLLWSDTWTPSSLNLWLSVGYSPNKAHLLRSHWPLRWSSWSANISRQSFRKIYSWPPQTTHFCPSELRKYEPSQDRYFPLWPQAAPTQPLAYVLTFPHMNEEPVPISCNFREHISVYLCRTGREKVSKSSHTSANQSPQLSCTPSKSGMGLLAAELVFLPLHCEVCESVVLQPGNESGPSAVKAQSPNHWTTRAFPMVFFFFFSQQSLHRSSKLHVRLCIKMTPIVFGFEATTEILDWKSCILTSCYMDNGPGADTSLQVW